MRLKEMLFDPRPVTERILNNQTKESVFRCFSVDVQGKVQRVPAWGFPNPASCRSKDVALQYLLFRIFYFFSVDFVR